MKAVPCTGKGHSQAVLIIQIFLTSDIFPGHFFFPFSLITVSLSSKPHSDDDDGNSDIIIQNFNISTRSPMQQETQHYWVVTEITIHLPSSSQLGCRITKSPIHMLWQNSMHSKNFTSHAFCNLREEKRTLLYN